jgi:hypothetical protein
VALVAFHALTAKQLATLKLTDIVDGRLALDGRDIPLASPVVVRLGLFGLSVAAATRYTRTHTGSAAARLT